MPRQIHHRAIRFEWHRSEPMHALLCLPAIAAMLLGGIAMGYDGAAVLLALGAVPVGFGSFQKPLVWRFGPMLLAAVGVAISGGVGSALHASPLLFGGAVVLWAFIYGLSFAMGPASAWVGQWCCVYLVIAAAAPAAMGVRMTVQQAAVRGGMLLAGGIVEMLVILLAWQFVPRSRSTYTDPEFDGTRVGLAALRAHLSTESLYFRFAFQMAAIAAASYVVFRFVHFGNAYWIVMTAVLLPMPDFEDTTVRSILRIAGTVLAAGLCTLVVVAAHPRGEMLAVLVLAFLYLGYATGNVNYGLFAMGITGYIVFILAIVHQPTGATIVHRVLGTAMGAAIALGMHALFRVAERRASRAAS